MRNKANPPSGETYFLWLPGSLSVSLHLDIRESDRVSLLPSQGHTPPSTSCPAWAYVWVFPLPPRTYTYTHEHSHGQTDPVIPKDLFLSNQSGSQVQYPLSLFEQLRVTAGHVAHFHCQSLPVKTVVCKTASQFYSVTATERDYSLR